jgi:hypothetical protein
VTSARCRRPLSAFADDRAVQKLPLLVAVALVSVLCLSCRSVYVPGQGKNDPGYTLKPRLGTCYEVNVKGDVANAFAATQKGFEKLQLEPTEAKSDKLTGVVAGRLADGTAVKVELSALTGNWTRLRLYIGNVANPDKSAMLFEAIQPYL